MKTKISELEAKRALGIPYAIIPPSIKNYDPTKERTIRATAKLEYNERLEFKIIGDTQPVPSEFEEGDLSQDQILNEWFWPYDLQRTFIISSDNFTSTSKMNHRYSYNFFGEDEVINIIKQIVMGKKIGEDITIDIKFLTILPTDNFDWDIIKNFKKENYGKGSIKGKYECLTNDGYTRDSWRKRICFNEQQSIKASVSYLNVKHCIKMMNALWGSNIPCNKRADESLELLTKFSTKDLGIYDTAKLDRLKKKIDKLRLPFTEDREQEFNKGIEEIKEFLKDKS